MKYLKQFFIILTISFVGELLKALIPLPIASGIYGIILMFLCLQFKIIKVSDIKEASVFLIELLPLTFIPATVGLIDAWGLIRTSWMAYAVITILSLLAVFAVSGRVTQWMAQKTKEDPSHE